MTTNVDKWIVVKVNSTPVHYRLFGTWAGGYLDGDAWRLNSGITKVAEDGQHLLFHGQSGSVYRGHKNMYGIAGGSNYGVIEAMIKGNKGEILVEDNDWLNFSWS